jgi:PAS domain S-box-containing protein
MQPRSGSVRVLHVDDEPDFADMAATFVEREDDRFDIETATSAGEGLDRLASDDFDCVVSDYDMPGRSGIEFLEAVREEYPDLPFVLYTGKGSEEVASDAISAGVTDYLQKESGTGQYPVLANRIRNAVEKYRTQTELADREKRLDLFFEESPMGVVEWDENFEFVRLNESAEEILGYDEADLVGKSWESIVAESDREQVGVVVSDLLEAEGGHHSINENVRKDGQRIVCEWHNRVVTDEDDEVITIFSQFRDITGRRRQERRFEAIFNNTYTFTGLMEPDGTLIEANDTALSFGGLDREDVVGKRLWETAWVRSNDEARETVEQAVERGRGGELFRDEIRVEGSDRDAIIDFSVRPITDERGEVTLLVPEGRDITERRERERRLEESEQTYRTLAENFPDGAVGVYDRDLRYDLVEGAMWEYMDANAGDLEGNTIQDVFSESVVTDIEPLFRAAIDAGETGDVITEFEGRTLRVWATPLRDSEGEIFAGLSFARDITDQVERERNLERTLDLLDQTERIADVGGWEIDTETQEVFWTDHLFEMLGRDVGEEPPLDEALDVYVEEDRPRVESAIEEALAAGESFDVEARFERPDREIRWFQIRGEPTVEDGETATLRGAVQDVTERTERERELERTEARFRALAENFPNGGVHYFDADARYEYVAGAGFDPVDTSPADLEGNTIHEVEPYSAEIVETLEPVVESTLAGNEETAEVSYEGHVYELRSAPIRGRTGEVIGGFFITQDVTDRRRWERALRRENEQLERFASVVSHDLRSPLTVARGRLELAGEECDSTHLDSVDDALERSQALIEDLLTLAREGEEVSGVETVDLGTLARDCWHDVRTAGATLAVETDRHVRADRSRLQQLLENLYRNAVEHGSTSPRSQAPGDAVEHGSTSPDSQARRDAAEQGGDDVTVTVGDLPGGFYVEDDGPGIPEDEREDVFEAGYSTSVDGTGFGLSIVEQIAGAHGWKILATDGAGGGARFEISGVEVADGEPR